MTGPDNPYSPTVPEEQTLSCPHCGNRSLLVCEIVQHWSRLAYVDPTSAYYEASEAFPQWDEVNDSYFMCNSCNRRLTMDELIITKQEEKAC
jgi:predicted RNA-binding Zn-ribbon protein involved in translation (DUF1610 family)